MRLIRKQREPASMVRVRTDATTDLSTTAGARAAFNTVDKTELRAQLVAEQGWLCAFCMRHIDDRPEQERGPTTMKIAHRSPIDVTPQLALTWSNLLGSCDGGQRSNGRYRTCDLAQESSPLTVDPTTPASIARLRYERRATASGEFLTSDDPSLRRDVEETLALNDAELPVLREAVWKAFLRLQHEQHPTQYGREARRRFLVEWRAREGERLPEFAGFVESKLGIVE